jgi:hypothetical protein
MDSYCWRASSIYLFILSRGRPRFGSSRPAGISFIHPSLDSLHHPRGAPPVSIYLFIRPLPSGSTFHCPEGGDLFIHPLADGCSRLGAQHPAGVSFIHPRIDIGPTQSRGSRHLSIHLFIRPALAAVRISLELPWLVTRITMNCQDFFGITMNSLQNYHHLSGFLRNYHEQSPGIHLFIQATIHSCKLHHPRDAVSIYFIHMRRQSCVR